MNMSVLEKISKIKEFETDIEQFNELVNVGFVLFAEKTQAYGVFE